MSILAFMGMLAGIGFSLYTLHTTPETDTITTILLLLENILPALCGLLPFTIFSGGLIYLGVRLLKRDQALKTHGKIAQATIIDKWVRHLKGTKHYVAFEFQAKSPKGTLKRYHCAEYNPRVHKHYEIGDTVPLRYMPHNPAICRLEAPTTAKNQK
jgi:hypothetical protein